jgi:1-deoxy-D-xylulose-5-phosphate reductoisomerase
MKRLSILGSTGSIGVNTLRVVAEHPDRFQVVALAAGGNVARLAKQIETFHPEVVSVMSPEHARDLKERLPSPRPQILFGPEGLRYIASHPSADLVIAALAGSIGLLPTLAAVEAKKNLAIANKEPLVMAGEILMRECRKRRVRLLPIDSEHSAIFQSLAGHRRADVQRLILTASGGPFLRRPLREFAAITPHEAMQHPHWRMGKKISVDSATLMNKGLEVIEAHFLFGIPASRIEVQIHPQSIVHSMVEYIDGSIIAQMAIPDMRGPIAYALSFPERIHLRLPSLDLFERSPLTFHRVDPRRFPALGLAYRALEEGGTMPAVLNGANEVAVEAFLQGQLPFVQIAPLIRKTMDRHRPRKLTGIEDVLEAHHWAQRQAREWIERGDL